MRWRGWGGRRRGWRRSDACGKVLMFGISLYEYIQFFFLRSCMDCVFFFFFAGRGGHGVVFSVLG